ncbi:toll/interleukin-1 receptor domain-containing protein [Amycolatopsis vancoresmycina]|uniref:WD40 repeat-containing protein n=1 Tax=Amycolatopsis vancoresmycina DSM 44592 TaxID=1292037 RepID=R1FW82_9PSEU|nr:toll/interleukin-1 receptor domain-containing protein [Amycolatopsis vancoresmycina]EOD63617.1 WD40 repeat-containing protein [Amycolatopsis vancoresmycina DSM 44592]
MAGHYVDVDGAAGTRPQPAAVFLSYAREPGDPAHEESVLQLWTLLRSCGVDARLDRGEAQQRRDWALWRGQQIREARYVLVIASPAYRRSAEGRGDASEERGVQWEARLIRDTFFADPHAVHRFIPVVLPGQSKDGVPDFLGPDTADVYTVSAFTVEGAEPLLRLLTDQPEILEPPLGPVPDLKPRPVAPAAAPRRPPATHVHNEARDVSGFLLQVGNVGSMTVPGPAAAPRVAVGDGADSRARRTFEDAWQRAGGRLGEPAGPAVREGPGFVQHFTGDAVICAVTGKQAVAVAGPVWDDLSGLPGFPSGPGFPTMDYVEGAAPVVDLDGGTWKAGVLLRDPEPRWHPRPRLDMVARKAFQLPMAGLADLTVRAIATLPWQLDDDLEITGLTRKLIESALPQAEITAQIPALSQRRGRPQSWLRWALASGPDIRQTGRDARYDHTGDDDVRAVARIMLSTGPTPVITVCVEFQTTLRITANEVVDLWTAAWDTAAVVVPRALVPDPANAVLLGPPTVELHVEADVAEAVDLSVFGKPAGRPGLLGAATVIAPIGFGRTERRAWAAKALTRLARGWGFVEAEESDLG